MPAEPYHFLIVTSAFTAARRQEYGGTVAATTEFHPCDNVQVYRPLGNDYSIACEENAVISYVDACIVISGKSLLFISGNNLATIVLRSFVIPLKST